HPERIHLERDFCPLAIAALGRPKVSEKLGRKDELVTALIVGDEAVGHCSAGADDTRRRDAEHRSIGRFGRHVRPPESGETPRASRERFLATRTAARVPRSRSARAALRGSTRRRASLGRDTAAYPWLRQSPAPSI